MTALGAVNAVAGAFAVSGLSLAAFVLIQWSMGRTFPPLLLFTAWSWGAAVVLVAAILAVSL